MSEMITFRLETTQTEVEMEKMTAQETGELKIEKIEPITTPPETPLVEARFVETVAIIAVASITWIAKRIVDRWLRDKEQGVQIDLRKESPIISRIAHVPMGFLVVIHPNGQVSTHQVKYDKGEDLVPFLAQILKL